MKTPRTPICVAIGLLLGALACSQEQVDWKQAESKDTIGIYRAFIKAHPESEHVETAKKRIDELRFERVKAQDSPFEYRKFIAKYPNSPYAKQVRDRLAELEITAAMQAGTAEALIAILRLHPKGAHAAQARARLRQLYPPFTKESVLAIQGLAQSVDPGKALVKTDEMGRSCTIRSGGSIAVSAGKTCGLLCRERLELGPEARVPVAWVEPTATLCTTLRLTDDFAVKLERPCKSGADATSADAALGYIVAGAQGAVLKKKASGYRLVEGEANYLKPTDKQKQQKKPSAPKQKPPTGKVTSGSATCTLGGKTETRKKGADWSGSEGGWSSGPAG